MPPKQRKQRKQIKSHGIYGAAYGSKTTIPNHTVLLEMSDGEIMAIGMMTVQWSYLEHMLLMETARLANRAKFRELPGDATSLAFSRRLGAWRSLVSDTIKTKKVRDRLLRLASKIANLEDKRHKITHGLWEWYPSNPDRLKAYSYRPPVEFVESNLNFKKIIALAFKIGEASYELTHPPSRSSDSEYIKSAMRSIKAHGYAYWSRRALLEMMGREHAVLVPQQSMRPESPRHLRASLESPPKA